MHPARESHFRLIVQIPKAKETQMAADTTPRKPSEAPVILPADPMGAGLTVIDVEKVRHADEDDSLRGPLGETTCKPYENEG
jgi:hypothetical protein